MIKSLSFSEIVNAPPITPGIAGWDVVITAFMDEQKGRQRFGLLSRVEGLTPPGGTVGSVLVASVPGWACMPLLMVIWLRAGAAGGTNRYQFWCGDTLSVTSVLFGGMGSLNDHDLSLSNLLAARPVLVPAYPDAGAFAYTLTGGGAPNFLVPVAVPFVNGDVPAENTFRVSRSAVDGGNTPTLGVWTYGLSWRTNDP